MERDCLDNNKDLYLSLLTNMPNAFAYHKIIHNDSGKPIDYIFLDVNSSFEKMTGLLRADILNKKVTEVLPDIKNSDFDWIGFYGNVALTRKSISFEQYSEPLSRWYEVTAYSDRPDHFATFFLDITDHKKLEKNLTRSIEEKEILLENIDSQVWYLKDAQTYGAVNSAHARFLGKDKKNLEQKNLFQILPEDEAKICVDGNEKVFKDKKPITTEEWLFDAENKKKLLQISKNPKLNANNEVEFVVCSANDITALKETEKSLKYKISLEKIISEISSNFVKLTSEELDEGIDHMLEATGNFFNVDRSYIFKFLEDSVYASNTNEWCAHGIEPQKQYLQKLDMNTMPWWFSKIKNFQSFVFYDIQEMPPEARIEKEILQSQDIKSLIIFPMLYKERAIGFFGFDMVREKRRWSNELSEMLPILANILSYAITRSEIETEMIQAKKQAENANNFKTQFLANISHEIRTPINGIFGYNQLLNETQLTKEQSEYVQNIHKSCEILTSLINDFLDISKIEAGKIKIEEEKFNLFSLIDNILNNLSSFAAEKSTKIEVFMDQNIPLSLMGSEKRLRQVIINILMNAIRYSRSKIIKFKVSMGKDTKKEIFLNFEIRDYGAGMEKAFLKNIYEPFVRGKDPHIRTEPGTGLGLHICKNIINAMNGNISIKSKVNKGTQVFFSLLFKKVSQDFKTSIEQNGKEKDIFKTDDSKNSLITKKNCKILLAEDNSINSSLFIIMLEKIGYSCDLVVNGLEAVEAFKNKDYDIIFMDCQMPSMSGTEATKEIRKIEKEKKKKIPIVAVSAYAMPSEITNILKSGMDDFITKPFKMSELKEIFLKYEKNLINNASKSLVGKNNQ